MKKEGEEEERRRCQNHHFLHPKFLLSPSKITAINQTQPKSSSIIKVYNPNCKRRRGKKKILKKKKKKKRRRRKRGGDRVKYKKKKGKGVYSEKKEVLGGVGGK